MGIYERKRRLKVIFICVAGVILIASFFFNRKLAAQLSLEEQKRVENLSLAFSEAGKLGAVKADVGDEISNLNIAIITSNTTIPIIMTDTLGNILNHVNVNDKKSLQQDAAYFEHRLDDMRNYAEPIRFTWRYVEQTDQGPRQIEVPQLIYYEESIVLKMLRIFPYLQFAIIGAFLMMVYMAFSAARKQEQDKVWLGMAKETAHQLGTPLTSLMAWVELLNESNDPTGQQQMIGKEINKDVNRLELIAQRFSKIGSKPELTLQNVSEEVNKTIKYMQRRAAHGVAFSYKAPDTVYALVNSTLFDWVIENLLKNALDAIENGQGNIDVVMLVNADKVEIQVSDTGKGIPKSKQKTVFEPGFTTKSRGWGLGLSLSKRIIETYHSGKIFVENSVPGKGTCFKITLPLAKQTQTTKTTESHQEIKQLQLAEDARVIA